MRTHWILASALVLAVGSGCSGCDDDEGNSNSRRNNNTNNETNNQTSNDPNNVPETCTPDYQFEDWQIESDRRLIKACSPYILDESADVRSGATLTIDPGVEVQLAGGDWLRITDGRILAVGTEEEPILLTARDAAPVPGSWLGVRFTGEAQGGNEIRHAIIEYGGGDQFGTEGCVTLDAAVGADRLSITDVTFRNCDQAGLAVPSPSLAEIARLRFEDMPGDGMSLGADVVAGVAEGFEYENCDSNHISNEDVTETATWVAQDVPYRVDASLDVAGENDPVLTIEGGVQLLWGSTEWFRIGEGEDGGIVIAGTPEAPVVMASAAATPAPGDWLGIRIGPSITAGSTISNLQISHAGGDSFGTLGCVTILHDGPGRLSIDDSTFTQCLQAGVATERAGFGFSSFTGNTFADSDIGMNITPNAVSTIGPQAYSSTPFNRLHGDTLSETGTWVGQDVPWRVSGSIDVDGEADPILTIEAGSEFEFETSEWLRVGNGNDGTLVIAGTADAPVVLRSAAATKAAGDWLGIYFAADTTSGTSLDYTVVEHGGQDAFGTEGCVTSLSDAQGRISITNSTFNECLQSGIASAREGFTFGTFSGNTFSNSDIGMKLNANAIGSVIDAQTYDNVPANAIDAERVTLTSTWVKQDVPWDAIGSIDVGDDTNQPILTIEAGSVFRFLESEWFRVGQRGSGTVVVNGAAGDRVRFTSRAAAPAAGSWLGINLQDGTATGTIFDNIEVEYAGQNAFGTNAGVTMNNTGSTVTISNSVFSNNLQADIYVDQNSTPTLTGNTAIVVNQ